MANRFTDTDKWEDPWFQTLPADWKAVWMYLCEKCNHAGVWRINMELLNYFVKPTKPITKAELLTTLNNGKKRVILCNSERMFVIGFIEYQYGNTLNPSNNAHRGVIKELKKHKLFKVLPRGLVGADQGLPRSTPGAQDKDKDKDSSKSIEVANKVIDYFNNLTDSSYKHSDTARAPIIARLRDGFTGKQCAEVIHKKYNQWKDDDKMCKFIRITTLFQPTKFEGYLNEKGPVQPAKNWL